MPRLGNFEVIGIVFNNTWSSLKVYVTAGKFHFNYSYVFMEVK